MNETKRALTRGMRTGIPIGLGYFASAIGLGILAVKGGMTPLQATLASLMLNASAGEYAFFTGVAAAAPLIEVAILQFVANMRYLLMSCAIGQRIDPKTKSISRLVIGFDLTDELFGASIALDGVVTAPFYFGMMIVAMSGWALGTFLGAMLGELLPAIAVTALGLGLYGMFLAIVVPPARKSKVLFAVVVISMGLSLAFSLLPLLRELSSGVRTIILTIAIAAVFALLFPVHDESEEEESK